MWFSSVLLFLAFTSAFADLKRKLEACVSHINVDVYNMEILETMNTEEQLKMFCPLMLNAFDCYEDVLKTETGMTFEDLVKALKGTEGGSWAQVAVNVRGIFVNLCTEGTRLNEAYLADADCYDTMENPVHPCKEKAEEGMEAIFGFAENVMEVEDDDEYTPDADCAKFAYMSACIAATLHYECGRRAFDTYNSMVKTSGVFKHILCSAEDLQYFKTTFVDTLDLDDDRKDLLRLAFDLKKRRK